jgi:hypothetical protein
VLATGSDLDLGYGFGKNKATRVGLCINNLLNNQASAFVGAPKMGMFTMLQLSHQIGVIDIETKRKR